MQTCNSFTCYCGYLVTDGSLPSETKICIKCQNKFHKKCFKDSLENSKNCIICELSSQTPYLTLNNQLKINRSVFLPMQPIKRHFYINFHLSEQQLNLIKSDEKYTVLIAVHHIKLESICLEWPNNLEIHINKQNVTKLYKKTETFDISPYLCRSNNCIDLKYDKVFHDKFLFTLIPLIKLKKEEIKLSKSYSLEICRERIITTLNDFSIKEEKISLRCPYSSVLMKCPIRSEKCQHIQCFDFNSYINFKKFKCPICKIDLDLKDLFEDVYYKYIISEVTKESKDKVDDYEIFIDCSGRWILHKKFDSHLNSNNKYAFESQEIEKLNYSDDDAEEKQNYEDINREFEEGEVECTSDKCEEYHKEFCELLQSRLKECLPKDYIQFVLNDKAIRNYLPNLNAQYLSVFILKCKLISKIERVFPHNIDKYYKSDYFETCKNLIDKHINFFNLITDWKKTEDEYIHLLVLLSKRDSSGNMAIEGNLFHDVYFLLEMLIAMAFYIFQPNQLTTTFEHTLARLLTIYFTTYCQHFTAVQVATIIYNLQSIFPMFDFPKKNLSSEEEKNKYFKKMVRFFYCFNGLSPEFFADVLTLIYNPIKEEIDNLKKNELLFINEFEENFLYPVFNCLGYKITERNEFINVFDPYGHFRIFLHKRGKLNLYGWQIKSNCYSKAIVVKDTKKINHIFEKMEFQKKSKKNNFIIEGVKASTINIPQSLMNMID
jgi:hypothetical protein